MLALIWSDSARDETQKSTDSLTLATDAHAAGDDALAAELRGQALLNRGDARGAADEFAAAVKAGDRSAELYLNFAAALHGIEDDPGAQSLLWRVISDRPLCREAYIELYALYDKRQEHDQAARVLAVWLTADPDNTGAPRLVAREAFQGRRYTQAERLLLELLEQHDSDPQVLSAVVQFYSETGRLNELAPKLRQRMSDEPWNWSLAIALSDIFQQQHQSAEAIRLLDEVQSRAANDPDLLYTLSGLYTRLGQKDQSEQVLAHVLKLDPSYAGASNDLGYTWAEQGKNLGEAETLVRKALQLEPDNLSFLDSMGWVLYKRGKYPEALQKLTRAALLADPVVLDHLGDTLYRLGERAKAAVQWQQATQKIADLHEDDRDDLKQLREQLLRKQQQLDTGQPVGVAPVAEGE
jgi:tetratricopeptide (TPR) repeat protein